MRRSLKYESYNDDFNNQCVKLLNIWINEYLERNLLMLMEIDYKNKLVFCYPKNCNNMFEDYFSFDYTKKNLFK